VSPRFAKIRAPKPKFIQGTPSPPSTKTFTQLFRIQPKLIPPECPATVRKLHCSQSVTSAPQIMSSPQFFQQPLRYLRWASHEKPAIFYSFVIGSGGPLSFFVAPPIRRFFNDGSREKIPLTYPSMLPFESASHYSSPYSRLLIPGLG
jgi:hypothetical protein